MAEQRRGVIFGLLAYGMWGLFPLYWPLLEPATAAEILAHRMTWSLLAVLAILAAARTRWPAFLGTFRNPRTRWLLVTAAVILAVNWLTYIWGVNHGHVVETSLGYFINPLFTVLLGVVLLGERLRPVQWAALGLGVVAVLVLAGAYGRLPWIALVLAGTFGTYGLIKKKAAVPAVESLGVETAALFLPALGYLLFLQSAGEGTFGHVSVGHGLLLVGAGLVTTLPLLAFGAAAIRVPLSTLGLMQYLAPMLQFLVGVAIFHEPMPTARWIGFALVWAALAVLTADALRQSRRSARPARITGAPVRAGA